MIHNDKVNVCKHEHSLKNATHYSVSKVSYIQSETVKQSKNNGTRPETNYETGKNAIDIKALAQRVLEQSMRNANETVRETKLETRTKIDETSLKRINKESLLYEFEERISIMVFDGKINEIEATNQAFLEFLQNNFLNTL